MTSKSNAGQRQIVSFYVNEALYGFDIRIVKEISQAISITPVPLNGKDVKGIVNMRGQVVLVLDVSVILNGDAKKANSDSQIIIIKTARELEAVPDFVPLFDPVLLGSKPVGFLVETIGDIITVQESSIESAPLHLDERHTPYIEGVVHRNDVPLIILNPGKMVGIS